MRFIVSDNGKWCHFRTSTRSSRDSDHLCFMGVVEFDNPFTNIHEFLSQLLEEFFEACIIRKVSFTTRIIFINQTTNFTSVKSRTTPKTDDRIRFKLFHLTGNGNSFAQSWVRLNRAINACFNLSWADSKLFQNFINETKFNHTRVSNDESFVDVWQFL